MSDLKELGVFGESEFTTFGSEVDYERELRRVNGQSLLKFGVSFLDEALGGLTMSDLAIVASKTGFGKTQLVMHTALSNALIGKRVHFFALEASKYEIEQRLKFQLIAKKFYALPHKPGIHLNVLDWMNGKFDAMLDPLEKEAHRELAHYQNLKIYYRKSEFTAKDFQRIMLSIRDQTDLVIVDHLHYFDLDHSNENQGIKELVKTISDTVSLCSKPVILVAHVRKSMRMQKLAVPDLEDIHGSSDTPKIGTKIITMGPAAEQSDRKLRQTLFSIAKCRADGARMGVVGKVGYNMTTQKYEDRYLCGELNFAGTEFKPFTFEEVPFWAVSASNPKNQEWVEE